SVWTTYHYFRSTGNGFVLTDTNVPFPTEITNSEILSPGLRVFRYGDINGDGIADAISCAPSLTLLKPPVWNYQLWKPANDKTSAGFDSAAHKIDALDGVPCWVAFQHLYIVDIDGDGKAEILAPNAPFKTLWLETQDQFDFGPSGPWSVQYAAHRYSP